MEGCFRNISMHLHRDHRAAANLSASHFKRNASSGHFERLQKDRHRRGKRQCQSWTQENAVQTQADLSAQPGHIFGVGRDGAWDEAGVGNPVVRCYIGDDEQRWYMWYDGYQAPAPDSNGPQPSSIGLAVSNDGITWQRGEGAVASVDSSSQQSGGVGQVLAPNQDWWWHDTRLVSVSDVQIFSSDAVNVGVGVYWMFYTGGSFEPAVSPAGLPGFPEGQEIEGLRTRVGLAMSQDGRNWARIEADHHTGALFDAGEEGEWDHVLNAKPQVLALGPNEMRMYYHTFDARKRKWVVGAASSRDGFNWQKQGPVFEGGQGSDFDACGAAAHCVVRDVESKRFVMFYEAVASDGSRTISLAVSKDGISGWQRLGKPILQPTGSGGWDSADVGAPCAVSMADGKWRLYYGGRSRRDGPWQAIGLAITDPDSTDSFEGLRVGFKRRTAKA